MSAFHDLFEPANRLGKRDIFPLTAGKWSGYKEWLREKLLDLSCSSHNQFVFFRKFVDPQNRDDILKIFVLLQNQFLGSGRIVMLFPKNARVQDA